MYELSVFEKVKRGDYTVLPYEANKSYSINYSELSSLGYSYKKGYYYRDSLPISSSKYLAVNAATSSDGSINYLNWRVVNQLYYRDAYNAYESLEATSRNYTDKGLFLTASIISSPYFDIGDGFKKGSITIQGTSLDLRDDSYNNLYDYSISSGSIVDRNYLDAYFGFEELYKYTPLGRSNSITKVDKFNSYTLYNPTNYRLVNIGLSEGLPIDSTGSGAKVDFKQQSYIDIPHHEELNYELSEDFSISFWIKAPISQSNIDNNSNSIITKKSYSVIQNLGEYEYRNDNGDRFKRRLLSSSLQYSPVDYYPYDLSIYNQTAGSDSGKIVFSRSYGRGKLTLTGSSAVNDGNYHHICVSKRNSLLSLYIDGQLETSGSDVDREPINSHNIIFGADDFNGTRQFSGSLDEIRFYSKAVTSTEVSQSLSNNTNLLAYQTTKIGNIFYKRGEVVVTTPVKKYHELLNLGNWTLNYKNRYTIYEYETLVRIKKGMYNKTMNPSSTQSPKSNLYLNDFTGSLSPYATTVGLYNKDYQLVAVGKLGRPLKMRDDVDVNIIVRWDY